MSPQLYVPRAPAAITTPFSFQYSLLMYPNEIESLLSAQKQNQEASCWGPDSISHLGRSREIGKRREIKASMVGEGDPARGFGRSALRGGSLALVPSAWELRKRFRGFGTREIAFEVSFCSLGKVINRMCHTATRDGSCSCWGNLLHCWTQRCKM